MFPVCGNLNGGVAQRRLQGFCSRLHLGADNIFKNNLGEDIFKNNLGDNI